MKKRQDEEILERDIFELEIDLIYSLSLKASPGRHILWNMG
jgi:hypothetical protein